MINEFRVSTDGTLFAFYDPGNAPWFAPKPPLEEWTPNPAAGGWSIPQPWMKGKFIDSGNVDGLGFEWVRFLPVEQAARELLKIVAEWADGEPRDSDAVGRLAFQLDRKGYRIPDPGDEDE